MPADKKALKNIQEGIYNALLSLIAISYLNVFSYLDITFNYNKFSISCQECISWAQSAIKVLKPKHVQQFNYQIYMALKA